MSAKTGTSTRTAVWKQVERRRRLKTASRSVKAFVLSADRLLRLITGAVVRILVLSLFVVLTFRLSSEILRNDVALESIRVPQDYADAGITSEVLTDRVADAILRIGDDARTIVPKGRVISPSAFVSSRIDVPGTRIDLRTAVNILETTVPFLPQPRSVGGEIVPISTSIEPDTRRGDPLEKPERRVQITLRFESGGRRESVRQVSSVENPDAVARTAAEAILDKEDPYVLCAYKFAQGDLPSAETLAQRIAEDPSQNDLHRIAAYWVWGRSLGRQKQYPEAYDKFGRALALESTRSAKSGEGLLGEQRYEKAAAWFNLQFGHEPLNAITYNDWSEALLNEGKFPEGLAKCEKAIELDPKFGLAHNNCGMANYELGSYDSAIHEYQEARADDLDAKAHKVAVTDDELRNVYGNLGLALDKKGRYEEAVDNYRLAINLNWDSPYIYADWAEALVGEMRYKDAILYCHRALNLDPNNAWAYVIWGNALSGELDYPGAIRQYEKASQIIKANHDFVFPELYLDWDNATAAEKQARRAKRFSDPTRHNGQNQ